MTDLTAQRLTILTSFMKVLGPVYFLAVAVANGGVTSAAFYNLVLFLIFLVELLILNVLLPFVQVYTILELLNHLSSEEYLSKMADLIHTGIDWSIKTLLACVVGLNLVQGMLLPVIDSVKRGVVTAVIQPVSDQRIVGCISGIGKGYQLLLRIIFTTGLLFLLTIVIVTASTT